MLRSAALKYTKANLDSSVEALREEKKREVLRQGEHTNSYEIQQKDNEGLLQQEDDTLGEAQPEKFQVNEFKMKCLFRSSKT